MKRVYVNWTYLASFEVPDNTTTDEIENMIVAEELRRELPPPDDKDWEVISEKD